MKKHDYAKWLATSVDIMYTLRGIIPAPEMKATIVLPPDIIQALIDSGTVEIQRRSKVFPYQVGEHVVYLKVVPCGDNQTKMQIKIAR